MTKDFYSKVFGWMFIGLLITFGSGYLVSTSESLITMIFSSSAYWIIFIAEIVIAIVLGVRIQKMNPLTAKLLYIAYTVLTGATFASLFLLFEISSILVIFLATSIIFGVFALIGKDTKIDLSKLGIFLLMTLAGIIILEIINIFLMNGTLDMILCIVGLVIFMGYIAYDMQKIKQLAESGINNDNMAIIGAFELYLDFINIFIRLLKLFGNERN